jgi:hypothetical protein
VRRSYLFVDIMKPLVPRRSTHKSFGLKVLVIVVMMLMTLACFDRVPDPPGVIGHHAQAVLTRVSLRFSNIHCLKTCPLAMLPLTSEPPGLDDTVHLPSGADSSPPRT